MSSSFLLCTLILVSTLLHEVALLPVATSSEAGSEGILECELCEVVVESVRDVFDLNKTFEELYPTAVKLCVRLLDEVKLNGEYMCPGIISAYGPPIQMVAAQRVLDPDTICKDLNLCTSEYKSVTSLKDFRGTFQKIIKQLHSVQSSKTEIHSGRANVVSDSSSDSSSKNVFLVNDSSHSTKSHKTSSSVKAKAGKITFLQISDIHLDLHYEEGSPTDCGLYFCCRPWYNGTGSAGYYGSYSCDVPAVTLDLLLDKVQRLSPPPDFIIYTGDNPPHDIWNETWSSQVQGTKVVVDHLADRLSGIRIFPAMGNHESWPANEYMGTLKEYKALTQNLSVLWEKWVELSPTAKASIAHGGYYSLEVFDGLRIISFNSDYGYGFNFYALLNYENQHFKHQWEWLELELEKAEYNREKVLLIAHIPPGDSDNIPEYGSFYLNITKRFTDTIIGNFFGHTHMDHFQLIQDEDGVYGVVMVAPSVTTFAHINPSFRVFTMDTDTFQLLGYTQYHLNITRANGKEY